MTTEHPSDHALAQRLQQLPAQRTPPAAVWEAIAAGIGTSQPADAPSSTVPTPLPVRQRPRWRTPVAWAMAASVAVLAVAMWPRPAQPPGPAPTASVLVRQADAMAGEYRQAIAALPAGQVPAEIRPALHELDTSAAAIRVALGRQPDATFLLDQLRRTYAKRLELTRMAAREATAATAT